MSIKKIIVMATFIGCIYSNENSEKFETTDTHGPKTISPMIDISDNEGEIIAEIHQTTQNICNSLALFKNNNPDFNSGINAMENLYNSISDPEKFSDRISPYSIWRTIVFGSEILTGVACEIVRCLSIFNSQTSTASENSDEQSMSWHGTALNCLYGLKAALYGIDMFLIRKDRQRSVNFLNAASIIPVDDDRMSHIISNTKNIKTKEVYSAAKELIALLKTVENMGEQDKKKLQRLEFLVNKTSTIDIAKNIVGIGGKILSFVSGTLTGLSITFLGQKSTPSYYLTLASGGIDAMFSGISTTTQEKPIIQKYTVTSEIIYLCDFFLERLISYTHSE